MCGMRTSRRTRSGFVCPTSGSTCVPDCVSPTISNRRPLRARDGSRRGRADGRRRSRLARRAVWHRPATATVARTYATRPRDCDPPPGAYSAIEGNWASTNPISSLHGLAGRGRYEGDRGAAAARPSVLWALAGRRVLTRIGDDETGSGQEEVGHACAGAWRAARRSRSRSCSFSAQAASSAQRRSDVNVVGSGTLAWRAGRRSLAAEPEGEPASPS